MTKKEAEYIKKVLERIKEPDQHIQLAITYVDKTLRQFDACVGQLKNQYDYDMRGSW
jgi:hypothetical protein